MATTAARPLALAPPVTGTAAADDLPPFRVPVSHFVVALGWLVIGSVGLVEIAPALARGAWLSPGIAATVHAFTLGWLVTSAYGALYQLGPVVLGIRPRRLGLAPVVLVLHTLGTGVLVAGMGLWRPPLIAAGWVCVALALAIWSWNMGARIMHAPRAGHIAGHIIAAFASIWVALALAGARIGNALGWWTIARESLVAAHVQLAAAGFGGMIVMGLGSRLFPMFLASRDVSGWPSRWCAPLLMAGTLAQVGGWLGGIHALVRAGGTVAVLGGALFLVQATRWVHSRARRALDHALRQLIAALLAAGAALAAGFAILWWPLPRMIAVYGVLLIVGSITLVVAAVYGRVIPFLTWLERYSPRAGVRGAGPKVTDLLLRWSTALSTAAWTVGAGALATAVGAGWPRGAAASAGLFALGSVIAAQQYLRLVVPALRQRAS